MELRLRLLQLLLQTFDLVIQAVIELFKRFHLRLLTLVFYVHFLYLANESLHFDFGQGQFLVNALGGRARLLDIFLSIWTQLIHEFVTCKH